MTWTVLEQCVIPHNAEQGPEDGLLIMPEKGLYVVADSHSSHVKKQIQGLTPGQFVLKVFLETCVQIPVPVSREDIFRWIENLSESVRVALDRQNRFNEVFNSADQTFVRRPGLVFVAFLPALRVIVRVGDCQYFLDGAGHNPGLEVDRIKANVRLMEMWRHLNGIDPSVPSEARDALIRNDPTGALMRSFNIHWQQPHRNQKGNSLGYPVVNGTPIPRELIEIIDVPDHTKRVTLTSDGMPPMYVGETLAESITAFNRALAQDPLCIGQGGLWGVRGAKMGSDGGLGWYDDLTAVFLQKMGVMEA